jgi:hypothetical protein
MQTLDPIIGYRQFSDGIPRDVYRERATGQQYIRGKSGEKVFGTWLYPDPDEADEPIVVSRERR